MVWPQDAVSERLCASDIWIGNANQLCSGVSVPAIDMKLAEKACPDDRDPERCHGSAHPCVKRCANRARDLQR